MYLSKNKQDTHLNYILDFNILLQLKLNPAP